MEAIEARHIQMADNTSTMEPHWGYVARVLPCTNDAGSCEYLDAVYVSNFASCPAFRTLLYAASYIPPSTPSGNTIHIHYFDTDIL